LIALDESGSKLDPGVRAPQFPHELAARGFLIPGFFAMLPGIRPERRIPKNKKRKYYKKTY